MIAQAASAVVGIWLMAAPAVLGYGGHAATGDQIVGPLVASFALIAMSGVLRSLRWLNLLFAAWMIAAPAILSYPGVAELNSILAGILLVALSFMRGRIAHSFGGGWLSLIHPR